LSPVEVTELVKSAKGGLGLLLSVTPGSDSFRLQTSWPAQPRLKASVLEEGEKGAGRARSFAKDELPGKIYGKTNSGHLRASLDRELGRLILHCGSVTNRAGKVRWKPTS